MDKKKEGKGKGKRKGKQQDNKYLRENKIKEDKERF